MTAFSETKMDIREYMKNNIVILDGAMGTLIQSIEPDSDERPEQWNLTHPQIIENIHREYFDAGSDIVATNTFGANIFSYSSDELEKIVQAAIQLAKSAREKSVKKGVKLISMSAGPTGRLLRPYGALDFEEAVSSYSMLAQMGEKYGVDMFTLETLSDSLETKAAILGIKEVSSKPVLLTNAYGRDCKLLTGAGPEVMVAIAEAMGIDAIGINCSTGPEEALPVLERLVEAGSVPIIFKPNGGLPSRAGGRTVFKADEDDFAHICQQAVSKGAGLVGGCCGITPEFIRKIAEKLGGKKRTPPEDKGMTVVSSYTHTVDLRQGPVLIGERINPTGKEKLKKSLLDGDMTLVSEEAIRQQDEGAAILDINCGFGEGDEAELLKKAVEEIQTVSNIPLQIDTADPTAMEAALRVCNGKAVLNSVNGTEASMKAMFPLAKKYGAALICLTFDERGIPKTVAERVEIAENIIRRAAQYGIGKKDLIFDSLVMTVSTDVKNPGVTLEAMKAIRERTGCCTVLGISNVSFGLPYRAGLNGTFLSMALEKGLSAAIVDTSSEQVMTAYYGFKALKGMDERFGQYMKYCGSMKEAEHTECEAGLEQAIIKGLKAKAEKETYAALKTMDPVEVIDKMIVPALDKVGKNYEEEVIYLPQLLMSAEAATGAFEVIKGEFEAHQEKREKKGTFVIATVKGDIHDIGKNIVKMMLESYGFDVIDLGKDVPFEAVVEAVKKNRADVAGLSALMTTNLKSMEDTIKQLKEEADFCKIVVGGAVVSEDFAKAAGADCYAADAMETVRFAEKVCAEKRNREKIK